MQLADLKTDDVLEFVRTESVLEGNKVNFTGVVRHVQANYVSVRVTKREGEPVNMEYELTLTSQEVERAKKVL